MVLVLVVALGGCAQMGSLFDGMSGQPMDEHTDLPAWYHIGHIIMPIISDLLALIRIALPLVLPLLL